MTPLLLLSCLAACASGLPRLFPAPLVRYAPSAVYQYRYEAPLQVKEESRDPLGAVTGSYSVAYPGGGLLTQTYSYPAPAAALFRTTEQGPLGPAGTIVSLRAAFDNSKHSVFLIEMLEQALDSRSPPLLTKTEAVLVEALPVFTNSKESAHLTALKLDAEAAGGLRRQELQLRDPGDAVVVEAGEGASAGPALFVNSKESQALQVFRVQSVREGLAAREPPIFGPDSIVVEAAVIPEEKRADNASQA